MKKLRIVVLMHETLVPPEVIKPASGGELPEWKTEYDVTTALVEAGHEVRPLGLFDDLTPLRESILDWTPHIAFVLLEEFHGVVTYDQAVVSYLELMRQSYTGCNPRGMMLSRDKALAKKILTYHRIPTPQFTVFTLGRQVKRPRRLEFPLFVKSTTEDASLGISQASIVYDDDALVERVEFVHKKTNSDAIVEQYIEGRELYVGVLGNHRLQSFPVWEMKFDDLREDAPRIATRRAKWDSRYQQKVGIKTEAAKNLPPGMDTQIRKLCKRVYRALNMSGYGRMDLRLSPDGRVYVLEANANPNLALGEDFAASADMVGIPYDVLMRRIINLGLSYHAAWKG